ncbi:MAG: ribonuclease PH [Dehalococcoidia bacterium]|nr:ribonuclease PH [Dehalococcoidia bacterium]MQG15999.1 ribonuclease PH [SAR202 cluster bacterium]
MKRDDGRRYDEMREVKITHGVQKYAEGSVIIETGNTKVLCAVSVEEGVPAFLKGKNQGWVTAEYSMLPRSTHTRISRSRSSGGRAKEIQRLIGRSIRAVTDLSLLGERTVTIDCDVLQADGGTRTAAITGSYVAFELACLELISRGDLYQSPLQYPVAATSVGIVDGKLMLDLSYEEDSSADVDFNVVMTRSGEFVEIQATGEEFVFGYDQLIEALDLAKKGIISLSELQSQVLGNNDK